MAAEQMIVVEQVLSNTVRETAKVQMILLPLATELSNPIARPDIDRGRGRPCAD
jgi:hypothetical protein